MMKILITKPHKYVKCSTCKLFDSINPLIQNPICDGCHQPLKEISEEEFKQKLYMVKKRREEKRKQLQNINNDNNYKNNNNININNKLNQDNNGNDDKDNINNINTNQNNININNNNYDNNHHHHHGHHSIKIIGIIGGGHHHRHHNEGNNNLNKDNNEEQRSHGKKLIILSPFDSHHHHHQSLENNISNNDNNQNNMLENQNEIGMESNQNRRQPFRIIVQRQHVPNEIFDPNFNLFGSTFDNDFQDNFSSNFRSNFRGNFANQIMNILSLNMAELRKKKQNPISEQNLEKLKKFNLTEDYCKKEGDNIEKPNCSICLEGIEIGKETVLLPCGHMFHSNCCITWLKKSNTCPICRFEIK